MPCCSMARSAEELIVTISANTAMHRLATQKRDRNQSKRDQGADTRSQPSDHGIRCHKVALNGPSPQAQFYDGSQQ